MLFENPVLIPFEEEGEAEVFYTYGKGKLLGIYASAADAIRQANENQGLVVSEVRSMYGNEETEVLCMISQEWISVHIKKGTHWQRR